MTLVFSNILFKKFRFVLVRKRTPQYLETGFKAVYQFPFVNSKAGDCQNNGENESRCENFSMRGKAGVKIFQCGENFIHWNSSVLMNIYRTKKRIRAWLEQWGPWFEWLTSTLLKYFLGISHNQLPVGNK